LPSNFFSFAFNFPANGQGQLQHGWMVMWTHTFLLQPLCVQLEVSI